MQVLDNCYKCKKRISVDIDVAGSHNALCMGCGGDRNHAEEYKVGTLITLKDRDKTVILMSIFLTMGGEKIYHVKDGKNRYAVKYADIKSTKSS